MSELDQLKQRIDGIERQLRRTRKVAIASVAGAIAVVVACGKHETSKASPEAPTSLELKSPNGDGSVHIDGAGIIVRDAKGTMHVTAQGLEVGKTAIAGDHISVWGDGGKSTIEVGAARFERGKKTVSIDLRDEAMVVATTGDATAFLTAGEKLASATASYVSRDTGNYRASISATRPAAR